MAKLDDLEDELMEILQDYQDLTDAEMKKAVKKTANTVKNIIKKTAPHDTEHYKGSWATKTSSKNSHAVKSIVYSKDRYRLTHLLEDGHDYVSPDGVRIENAAEPHEHIAPAVEIAEKELMYQLQKIYKAR